MPVRGYERLVSLVGEEAAETLCRERGGGDVYVPAGDDGVLVRLVGLTATKALRAALGAGLRYEVPLSPLVRNRARQRAAEALRAGASIRSAARQAGLHPRTVREVKRTLPPG